MASFSVAAWWLILVTICLILTSADAHPGPLAPVAGEIQTDECDVSQFLQTDLRARTSAEHRKLLSESADCPSYSQLPPSNCYKDSWVDEMAQADPSGGKVFVDVGCNTGADAIMWLERWGTGASLSTSWATELQKQAIAPGTCGQNRPSGSPRQARHAVVSSGKTNRVFCIEAMPASAQMIKNISETVLGHSHTSFAVINAAASNSSGMVKFPTGNKGEEVFGINNVQWSSGSADVRMLTIDELMLEHGLTSLDVLTIDTEGADPSVIQGASKALSDGHVRYLVFEVNQVLSKTSWAMTSLLSQVQFLDGVNYDCYFAGNDGYVSRLTGCWTNSHEAQHSPLPWSNVVCVRRGDQWHAILENYTLHD